MNKDNYPCRDSGYSSNTGIIRSLSTVVIFVLGIGFGILLLQGDIKSLLFTNQAPAVGDYMKTEFQPPLSPVNTPELTLKEIIPAVADAPMSRPAVSMEPLTTAAAGSRANAEPSTTVPEGLQAEDRVLELVKLTGTLQMELADLKKERRQDQITIDNLRKESLLTQERLNMLKQPPLQQSDEKTVLPKKLNTATTIPPLEAGLKAFTAGDYDNALKLLAPLAAKGDSRAQYHVALMYRNGLGILADNKSALKWMQKAARQGYLDAQIELARFYANGIDGIEDPFLACTWYLVAEKNGAYRYISERTGVENRLQLEMLAQAAALASQLYNHQLNASVKEATVID